MLRPAFRLKIREGCGLVIVVALCVAFILRESAHRRAVLQANNELREYRVQKAFREFMEVTFGDLGMAVIKAPDRVEFCPFPAQGATVDLDYAPLEDILAQSSIAKGIAVPAEFGTLLYHEFTPFAVENLALYHAPAAFRLVKFTRAGDKVLVFVGVEGKKRYAKVFVLDPRDKLTNPGTGWFGFESKLIDGLVTSTGW
jgi:hypothetical protein